VYVFEIKGELNNEREGKREILRNQTGTHNFPQATGKITGKRNAVKHNILNKKAELDSSLTNKDMICKKCQTGEGVYR